MLVALISNIVLSTTLAYAVYKLVKCKNQLTSAVEELSLEVEKAQESEKNKTQFLATMSHEIRTPLNGLLVATKLLEKAKSQDEINELVDILNSSGDQLSALVNDILDLSKMEEGHLKLDFHPVNIKKFVKNIQFAFKKQFEEKALSLNFELGPHIGDHIYCDEVRLKQIFFNLISNAYKFTESGGVTVKLHSPSKNEFLYCSVEDSGIGIAKDKLEKVFETYTQETASTFKKYGGTGLGLSIVKKLVELLRGDIKLYSEYQQGSTFHFYIDARECDGGKADIIDDQLETVNEIDFSNLSVLIADDNQINRKVANLSLNKHGIRPDLVCDGQEAIDAVFNKHYDLVLMDINMPNKTGIEASEEIIDKLDIDKWPLIIALSADAFKENKDACYNAGMSDFISKPVTLEKLQKALIVAKERKDKKAPQVA